MGSCSTLIDRTLAALHKQACCLTAATTKELEAGMPGARQGHESLLHPACWRG